MTHPSVPDIARPDPVTDRDSPPVYVGVMCPMDVSIGPIQFCFAILMPFLSFTECSYAH